MEDITDADYAHAKRACKNFQIKNVGQYHDLYIQGAILLFADVSENLRNMCLIKYKLDPAKFISAPGLAWQAALKMTKVKLGLLTDIGLLLMVQKRIRGGIATLFVNMQKIMKDYI